ncbi:MAG: polysaccharide pyruvyl transferase family protein [Cyanobacteriota bacterium]
MNVGIITFSNVINYGAVLQAYALQRKIRELGHEPTLINYHKQFPGRRVNLYNAIDEGLLRLRSGDFQDLARKYNNYKGKLFSSGLPKQAASDVKASNVEVKPSVVEEKFREFLSLIPTTSESYDRTSIFSSPPKFDAYVTGSDQVWNYRRSNDLDAFLLRFAPEAGIKIAYAASFGVDSIPFFLRGSYKSGLKRFQHISVREDSGVQLVKSIAGRSAQHVVDPTLLLEANHWSNLMRDTGTPPRYILVYSLTISKNLIDNARLIAQRLGAEIVWLGAFYSETTPPDITIIPPTGPREFLSLIHHALYVLTDSFHGTAFSLTFNIPFLYIGDRYNKQISRARSLLKILGLDDRLQDDMPLSNELISKPLDYSSVNRELAERRRSSLYFLQNALGA